MSLSPSTHTQNLHLNLNFMRLSILHIFHFAYSIATKAYIH